MVTDHERVIADLKVQLQSKDSHGRRELLAIIGELEAEHTLSEGTIERACRLAGVRISEDLLGKEPASPVAAGVEANGSESDLS